MLSHEFKKKWIEKLLTLFVSGKMIFFFSILITCIVLVCCSILTPGGFVTIMVATISNVCIMRGAVEIMEIRKNGKVKKDLV